MLNKMQPERLNIIQGGNIMKCSFCGVSFDPLEENQNICGDCAPAVDELTNGEGDDNDE